MDKYTHGGNIYDNLIKYDFSANINPLGMPLKVKQTIVDNIPLCEHYPDVDYRELKKEIAAFRKVDEECVLCGNGAIEIIYKICSVVKPQRALLAIPCFSEYEKALSEALAHIVKYNRSEEYDFRLREDYIDYLTPDIDMAILCQPNNPSGDMIEKDLLDKIIKKAQESDIFLVIDECFIDFVKDNSHVTALRYLEYEKLLVVNAFTKVFAMPGLRLGYGISSNRELIRKMSVFGPEWSVSVPAQLAGVEALKENDYLLKTVEYVEDERKYLISSLREKDIRVIDSAANFLMIKFDKNQVEKLYNNGIMIRDLDNIEGLCGRGYYRIAVRTHKENEELVKIIQEE